MLGKVKQWLGIEGVKLELLLPEPADFAQGRIQGHVRLMSMHPQVVTAIKIVMIERYSRGRGEERLVDEYQLGSITLTEEISVPAQTIVERPFTLPFSKLESEVDEFGRKNLLSAGIARAARWVNQVSSEYRLEAEAQVKGVGLNPFDRKMIELS